MHPRAIQGLPVIPLSGLQKDDSHTTSENLAERFHHPKEVQTPQAVYGFHKQMCPCWVVASFDSSHESAKFTFGTKVLAFPAGYASIGSFVHEHSARMVFHPTFNEQGLPLPRVAVCLLAAGPS